MTQAIVIGAGFGGMAAALRLRAAGMQVRVFDNQKKPGGRATVYRRAGYTFDAGPTVITAPFLFDELFALFGKTRSDYVRFEELTPWYRIHFHDGRTFDYGGTEEQLIRNVAAFSPGDEAGYRTLLREVEQIYRVGFQRLADVPFDRITDMLRLLPEMIRLRSDRSVYSFVSRHIQDESLRRVFSFRPLLVGGNPFTTTSIYSLIQHLERTAGVHFAMGGTGALVSALARLMNEEGIRYSPSSPVAEVLIADGRAYGVRLEDGQEIQADVVVANADAPALYKKLVPACWRKKWTDRRIDSRRFSMGLFVLYLGVRKTYPQLAHHTIVLGREYRMLLNKIFERHELSDDISLYLHAPTRTDASLAPEGCESLYALVPVPNLQAEIDWSTKASQLEQLTLDVLERTVCPGLRDAIEVKFHVTPEHFQTELLTHVGSGFSLQPTLLQSAWFRFHNKSEDVEGLYLVGAGTHPGAGLPGVLCSAKVLEKYLPEMLGAGRQGLTVRQGETIVCGSEALMARSGKTFYRAARLLPKRSRASVVQLYRFCRMVDDLADESGAPVTERMQRLHDLEHALHEQPRDPGSSAAATCALYGWTPALAQSLQQTRSAAALLVRTAAGDLEPQQPKDTPELERYAFGVAGTVGLMLAELLDTKPQGRSAAIHLGIAMQLTNIARDVREDFEQGRVYLPADQMPAEAVQRALVSAEPAACRELTRATQNLLALAETHYSSAFDGIWTLPWRVRWSILAAGMCYREIGIAVVRDIPASWRRRTVVSSVRKSVLLGLAALRLLLPRFWRAAPQPNAVLSLPASL